MPSNAVTVYGGAADCIDYLKQQAIVRRASVNAQLDVLTSVKMFMMFIFFLCDRRYQ